MIHYLIRNLLLFISAICILTSCASTGRPNGGPTDEDAPVLIVEKSSPNFSTNYTPEKIILEFDEWIELKNQNKEILISPPFFKKPKISQRGKKVTVEFPIEEPLRPDATYTVNFGNSIVDFTEANPVKGFKFVFATGDKIDSLTMEGTIVDAYGGDPVDEVLIMLYDVLGDSVVVSDKPFYYARADKGGTFKFENLKNDTFKLIVIEDLNYNYLLDDEVEQLAFLDSTFILNDSSSFSPELRLFIPEQSTRIVNSNSKTPGLITTIFNKQSEEVDFEILYPENFDYTIENVSDTLKLWYSVSYDSVGVIYGLDTLDFTLRPFDSLFYQGSLNIVENNFIKSKLAPFDSLKLSFNVPLSKIDTSLIILSDMPKVVTIDTIRGVPDSLQLNNAGDSLSVNIDSIGVTIDTSSIPITNDNLSSKRDSLLQDSLVDMVVDTMQFYKFDHEINLRTLTVSKKWKEGHDYQLMLLPGALTDIYNRSCDTVIYNFTTSKKDEFGNIALTVAGLDSTEQYVVHLRDGNRLIKNAIINNKGKEVVSFYLLPVSNYNVHLIKDENRDQKWTTGDYWKKRQPELLKKFELEKLRENWDLEATISWDGSELDTMGVGLDSTLMQLDSLGNPIPQNIEKQDNPKKKKAPDTKDKKRGIRGRRG